MWSRPAGQYGQAQEFHARQAPQMNVRGIGADLPAAVSLSDPHLAEPLTYLVGDHERRGGEQKSITVSGRAIRPADRLLDAACPARV
jgi:hypothetical protein